MSNRAKLSQHTGILLERARRFGISDEALLACIATGETAPLQVAVAQYYSYDEFISYAHIHKERLEDAVRFGYQMKFNTPGGVQQWLRERFELEVEVDFKAFTGRVDQVTLSNEQLRLLSETLADNWVILEDGIALERERTSSDNSCVAEPRSLMLIIRSEHKA
ncbi:hypothetical protein [Cohnella sp. WQ 127256]|uniref:hypothetical protein n=1 Tax=Cohnella sp. WQ 127256 TaxID=2938790 RepID=UPI0021197C57|nr:hypothetical protein [Cohnella sp. WQ 127256]